MNFLPWLTLDALQAGALLALAAAFSADSLHRRDRLTGWVGLACLMIALRHGVGILEAAQVFPLDIADRLQSALASLGYTAMFCALFLVFPTFYPRHMVRWIGLGMLPNLVRCAFLPLGSSLARGLHLVTLSVYMASCALTLLALVRAHRAEDPFGRRLLGGLLITMIPVVVEVVFRVCFDVQFRISGIGIMLMAISLGASWMWALTHAMHERLARAEGEAAAWRGLLPGSTWHSGEASPLMEDLFGAGWAARLEDRMPGRDGSTYLVHRAQAEGRELGWVEARREKDVRSFLGGWTLALGMEEGEECQRILGWLRGWGAQVELWGTVPPREGPFPSILLWMREPSILSVWREHDLVRRRSRWIQMGGPQTEGPHVRLERPLEEESLREALQHLIALNA